MTDDANLVGAWAIPEGSALRAESDVDELGQFGFDALVTGAYQIELGLAYELVEIGTVRIWPRRSARAACGRSR